MKYCLLLSIFIAINANAVDLKYNPEFNEVICGPDGCQIQDRDPCTDPSYRRWWQIQCMNGSEHDAACFRCNHIKSGIFTGSSDGTFGAYRKHQKLEEAKEHKSWSIGRRGKFWKELMPSRLMKRLEEEK